MRNFGSVILLWTVIFISVGFGSGQERGQYLPGFRGLNVAEQPPPGVTYANYFIWYPTNKFKDQNGTTPGADIDINLLWT